MTWERIDQPKSERVRYTAEGHGTEIEIVGVDFDDAGTYRCSARNRGTAAQAYQDIVLIVEGQYFSLYACLVQALQFCHMTSEWQLEVTAIIQKTRPPRRPITRCSVGRWAEW